MLNDHRLVARRLGRMEFELFATPDYVGRRGLPLTPDASKNHNLVMKDAGPFRRGWKLLRGIIVLGAPHLRRILKSYADYYNGVRTLTTSFPKRSDGGRWKLGFNPTMSAWCRPASPLTPL